jgi:hypothetical protein
MNVEIGAEAAQFPEKEYINGIAVAVQNNVSNSVSAWHMLVIFWQFQIISLRRKIYSCAIVPLKGEYHTMFFLYLV